MPKILLIKLHYKDPISKKKIHNSKILPNSKGFEVMRSSVSSIHIFIFLFSLLQYRSSGSNLVHQSCKRKSDPNLSYTFCVTSLETNLKNKSNVTNPEELASTSIELAMSNATKIASKISMFLRQTKVIDPYKRLLATLLRRHFFYTSRETRLQIEEFRQS